MNIKVICKYIGDWFAKFLLVVCAIGCIFGAIKSCDKDNEKASSPVEDIRIDSLIKDNTKLIIEIDSLDSIKNVKTIEVKTLDNDNTLRLFYELIRK